MKKSQIEIKNALVELEDDEGRITPEAVVQAATATDSILHDLFEWDDSAAAHKYRLDQARTLIRSVRVEFHVDRRVVTSVAYIQDPAIEPGKQGYRSIAELRRHEEEARAALIREFSMAGAHLRRARELAVALSLEGEVDILLGHIGELRTRAEVLATVGN